MKFFKWNLASITAIIICVLMADCNIVSNDKVAPLTDTVQIWKAVEVDSAITNYIYNMNDSAIKMISDEECSKAEKNMEYYDKGNERYSVSNIKKIDGDINGDKRTDFLVYYSGDNCWGGIGHNNYLSNFFFMVSANGQLQVDESLTMRFKQVFLDTLAKYCPNETNKAAKASFINGLEFQRLNSNSVTGSFSISLCGDYSDFKGDFEYNIPLNTVILRNLEKEKEGTTTSDYKQSKAEIDNLVSWLAPKNRSKLK